jgi:CRISPR-associated protein Cas2
MLFIAYDISDDKTRTKFCKFLKKFGRHLQYSLFEIQNSQRVLDKILTEIELKYKKKFKITDSILIWNLTENEEKRILRYGYAVHEEEDLVVFD